MLWLPLAASLFGISCESGGEPMAEGVFAQLGQPIPSASPQEREAFQRGRAVALRRFTPDDGLGPEWNVTFCAGCHEKPVFGGGASHYRDFLLIGDELDTDVVVPRGKNGVQRQFSLTEGRAPSDPLTNLSATRNPLPFFGAGLLSEIGDEEIARRADPEDRDGDGISGRVNVANGQVGRFGRKAQTARLELFVRGPIFNHMGITSEPLSEERRAALPMMRAEPSMPMAAMAAVTVKQAVIPDEPTVDLDEVPDPELSEDELFDLLSFVLLMAAPPPDPATAASERGRAVFERIGCESCHVSRLEGPRGALPVFSDLLLHDMGDALADGFPMGSATGREFRTQPLWGIPAVGPYLHDGRASTLDEAIRWHGGEAASANQAYLALRSSEQADLIAFLESLGGSAQRSEGLLPPDAGIPADAEYGAPVAEASAEERLEFERGRALFDRDFALSEGVGADFNGDGCRSCHFDPVIGGAGPAGVDVIRQGTLRDGIFIRPPGGTALPRHSSTQTRPEPATGVNVFERRQTPTTLGLGLLEKIPRATIEGLAARSAGGRAHVLSDGRLGRFGWKAEVPSIREFVRDALSAELGLTVPEEPGASFGLTSDDDLVEDPEVSSQEIDGMTAFIRLLGPPPRTRTDHALEDQGEALFEQIGCASCHVPELRTGAGAPVRAYTDLLLHQVLEGEEPGIEEGDAGIHDFRTPPLWGLARSAPYFHDGRAATIRAAVEAHAGEASEARRGFEALATEAKAAVVAFLASL
jgi:CxxC motif-containing protein (DUF1111 family)